MFDPPNSRFVGMHMVHQIVNGGSPNHISMSGSAPPAEEDGDEERRKLVQYNNNVKITDKGKNNQESREDLISRLQAENADLASQLSNKPTI